MIKIIIFHKSLGVRIVAPVIRDELKKLGYASLIIYATDLDLVPASERDVFFVFTPHKFGRFKRNGVNKNAKFIAFQQEQFSDKDDIGILRINQFKKLIGKYDFVVDIDHANNKYLKRMGHGPEFILPTAYHEYFEFFNKRKIIKSKYDCLFFGRYHDKPRRQKILKKLSKKFNFYPKYEDLYGLELKKAILDSKIVLNIHQCSIKFSEFLRLTLAMCNRRLVISEPINYISPLEEGEHIIFSSLHNLPNKIRFYLNNPEEYDQITDSAYNFIKKNFRMDDYIKKFAAEVLEKNNLH